MHPVYCDFGVSRWKVNYGAKEYPGGGSKDLTLQLFDGQRLRDFPFGLSGGRFEQDLLSSPAHGGEVVSRNDRLSRAAANVGRSQEVSIPGIYESKHWNGRLQLSREKLEKLRDRPHLLGDPARVCGDESAKLGWFLSHSAQLEKKGPWIDYKLENGSQIARYHDAGFGALRKLPGLRVIGVDLGHRFAAACAVWETITKEEAAREIGRRPMPQELYVHLPRASGKGSTIYRRIGSDDSPAPWAKLERQFLIKLDGENEKPRKASPTEMALLAEFRTACLRPPYTKSRASILEVEDDILRTLNRGIRRLGELARVAYFLSHNEKPGMAGQLAQVDPIELRLQALLIWRKLARREDSLTGDSEDGRLRREWEANRLPLDLLNPETTARRVSKQQEAQVRERLEESAQRFVQLTDARPLAETMAALWEQREEEIKTLLRKARRFVFPPEAEIGARFHRGGIGVDRLRHIRTLYDLRKAFRMRPTPAQLLGAPRSGNSSSENFARRTLQALETRRENRVKQIASRIVEAALGIGAEPHSDQSDKAYPKRAPRKLERPADARFRSCHAVAIENLKNYRPDELQTRRENRQLMEWSSSKVEKYLKEACDLNGLQLVQVKPTWTSSIDSRTGSLGVRCRDFPSADCLREQSLLARKLKDANEGKLDGEPGSTRYLQAITHGNRGWSLRREPSGDLRWHPSPRATGDIAPPIRLPQRGGDIFVSGDPKSPLASGIQADLNAASNIALRSLLDPDWVGTWTYVLADPRTGKLDSKWAKDASPLKDTGQISIVSTSKPANPNSAKVKSATYCWRKPSSSPLRDSTWETTGEALKRAEQEVMEILLERATRRSGGPTDDEIPL
jgi:hypothetical protein